MQMGEGRERREMFIYAAAICQTFCGFCWKRATVVVDVVVVCLIPAIADATQLCDAAIGAAKKSQGRVSSTTRNGDDDDFLLFRPKCDD